jgi:hypothetical protein
MRAYVFIETKAGANNSVIQTIIDSDPQSKPFVVTGDYDVVFKAESKDEDTLYEESQKIFANPSNIEKIRSVSTFILALSDKNSHFKINREPTHIMFVKTVPGLSIGVVEAIRKRSEVRSADLVYGKYDLISEINCDSANLGQIIYETQKINGVLKTSTIQVL